MRIWDTHVHLFTPEAVLDPLGWSQLHGEPHWGHLVTKGPQGWATVEQLLQRMDADGVEVAWLLGWYWQQPETVLRQNDYLWQQYERYPDRFRVFASVAPNAGERGVALAREALDSGFHGLGECLPFLFQEDLAAMEAWVEILELAQQREVPLNMHITEPVGPDYPGKIATSWNECLSWVDRFDRIKWIFAHLGGGLPFYRHHGKIGRIIERIWWDTAAAPLLFSPPIWKQMVNTVDSGRILFGSDFPLRLYPRQSRQPEFRRFIEEIKSTDLTAEELECIFSGNAMKVLV